MSASRSRDSASQPAPLATTMPMLAVTTCSERSRTNGLSSACWMRSATRTASPSEPRSSQSTTNSSPPKRASVNSPAPKRATVSLARRTPFNRSATSRSSRSPALWPSVSFTSLNRSRSRNSSAANESRRAARASTSSSRSRKRSRFARPVSASCVAWWASCSWAWIRSTTRPSWRPIWAMTSSSAGSGAIAAPVKNSSTAITPPSAWIGNANAPRTPRPCRAKLGSRATSVIHAASPVANTRPGSPTPGGKLICSVRRRNSANWSGGSMCQLVVEAR